MAKAQHAKFDCPTHFGMPKFEATVDDLVLRQEQASEHAERASVAMKDTAK